MSSKRVLTQTLKLTLYVLQLTSVVSSTLRAPSCWCVGTRLGVTCRSSGPMPTWTHLAASPGCTGQKTPPLSVTLSVNATPFCPSGTSSSTTHTRLGSPSWGEKPGGECVVIRMELGCFNLIRAALTLIFLMWTIMQKKKSKNIYFFYFKVTSQTGTSIIYKKNITSKYTTKFQITDIMCG